MNPTQLAPLEAGNRIQLPAEWVEALGLHGQVALDRTPDGILVRPCPPVSWEEIFATRLVIGSAPPGQHEDVDLIEDGDFLGP